MKLGEIYDRYQEKLDKLSEKLCGLNNKYILKIGENDLNPDVPLLTDYDVEKNKKSVRNYIFLTLGAVFGTLGSCYGIAGEMRDMINSPDVMDGMKNLRTGLPYVVLGDFSMFLSKKFNGKLEILQKKRNLEKNVVE